MQIQTNMIIMENPQTNKNKAEIAKIQNKKLNADNFESVNDKDLKKEKISYLLQNHFCEETVITKCSIPIGFKFNNKLKK